MSYNPPNSPATDIATLLLDKGLVTNDPDDTSLPLITAGMEPNIDKRVLITIYDTSGTPSNPAYQRDEPRIQVRVKAADEYGYPEAYAAQQMVKDNILGMLRQVINNTMYVGVWQTVDISSLTPDVASKPILVASYRIIREYATELRKPIE